MKNVRVAVLLVLGIILLASAAPALEKKSFTLAVVPQARSVEVIEKWTPFVKRLSRELGVEIEITPYNSMAQFEADIAKGAPDFVYMNPYHQAVPAKSYIPLVKDKSPLIGILVARKGSSVSSIKDMNGKEIAFPAPNAFAASLYMRALLAEKEKLQFTPQYVKTHSNVYRSVAFDKSVGGGGVKMTLAKEPDDVKSQLIVVYETPGTASHPLAAHPRVPEALRNKLSKTILAMAGDPSAKALLTNIQLPEPVEADFQRDYLPLKKLGLEKYVGKEMD